MWQFITWRFWLSLVGLVVALGTVLLVRDLASDDGGSVLDVAPDPVEHRVDLVALVTESHPQPGYGVVGGTATGRLDLVLDGNRRVTIHPGTPIDATCDVGAGGDLASSPCALVADLLGEAVVWAAIVPAELRGTLTLPPVVELRDEGWTLLGNGWEVQRAASVERECAADTTSLADLVRRFGPRSTTTFNLAKQEIVKVSCGTP